MDWSTQSAPESTCIHVYLHCGIACSNTPAGVKSRGGGLLEAAQPDRGLWATQHHQYGLRVGKSQHYDRNRVEVNQYCLETKTCQLLSTLPKATKKPYQNAHKTHSKSVPECSAPWQRPVSPLHITNMAKGQEASSIIIAKLLRCRNTTQHTQDTQQISALMQCLTT